MIFRRHTATLLAIWLGATAPVAADQVQPDAASPLQQEALAVCRAQRGDAAVMPPQPFTSDGCSAWPDGNWGHCCLVHDMQYWCGGSATQRWEADRELQQCLVAQGRPAMGFTMRLGARLGGWRALPLPWRWGYGWPYLQEPPAPRR